MIAPPNPLYIPLAVLVMWFIDIQLERNKMSESKPRKVKAKITRVVTEVAIVYLDRDGNVEEFEETHQELDSEVTELHDIRAVISGHSY
jgi:benzoyl-CoA reductase/2-hydroxyglutaryl-CoA dehydratase subunit BcrC/BadD/HgdB